ncbi:uncharacterized protein LOC144094220 isoform X2 [Amblyomma americanum]
MWHGALTVDVVGQRDRRRLTALVMLNRGKEAVIVKWLACYHIKVQAVSDLQDGLQLLHLLSFLDPAVNSENVDPSQTFTVIEKTLCDVHGFLPAHFLTRGDGTKVKDGCSSDAALAMAAVLALSALALRAARCSPTSEVAPLLQLDHAGQTRIKELIEIVDSGEDVLDVLQAYIEAGLDEESPPSAPQRAKRRKSTSFTLSPSTGSPLKRLSPSPQQHPRPPVHCQIQELKMLREHMWDEEQTNAELRQEAAELKEAVKHKDKQIKSMNERIQGLRAENSEQNQTIAALQDNLAQLQAQNKFLEDKATFLEKVHDDYDTAIRQNISLQSENEKLSGLQQECQTLRESLAANTVEMSQLASRLTTEEERNAKLSAELAEKMRDLEAAKDFYSVHRERQSFLSSPETPSCKSPGTPRLSCYQELLLAELQDTNAQLLQDKAQLQNELEAVTVKFQTDTNALKATILQLEQTKVNLTAEVSQLDQHCSQLDGHAAGLEAELQASKMVVAKLESELSMQAAQMKDLRLELASKDQQITMLDAKSTSCEASNKELLNSNEQLNAALRSLEAEHLSQLREAASENERHQKALSEELAVVQSLDEAAKQLKAKLCEEIEKGQSLQSSLAASQEENAKLRELTTTMCSNLAQSVSRNMELKEMLGRVEREKGDQLAQLAEVRDKLEHAGLTMKEREARVQELEASQHHLDAVCCQLRLQLSEREGQLKAAVEGKDAAVKMMENVQAAHSALRTKFDLASQEYTVMTTSLQQQAEEHKNTAGRLWEEKQVLVGKIAVLESELKQLRASVSNLLEDNAQLGSRLTALTQSHKQLNSELCVKKEQSEQMAEECGRLQQSIESDAAEKKALEAHLEQEKKAARELEEKCAEQASLNERLSSENLALKDALQVSADEVSAVRAKLAASEERERLLKTSNASLDSLAAACKDQLRAGQAQLDKAAAQVESLRQEVSILQQAITRLNLEKQFLHSSLAAAEKASRSLNEACVATTHAADDLKQRLEDSEKDRSHLTGVIDQLRQECASLKSVLSDTSEKLTLSEREVVSTSANMEALAALTRELEAKQGVLKHQNQALEDRIGDLEVKLNSQLQLQKKAEDDYYECVKERDANKESLKQQIDELTAEVMENARLQQELEELRRARDASANAAAESAAEVAQLRAEKGLLEADLSNLTNELRKASAKHDELYMKCKILENKNEGLKYELKSISERFSKRALTTRISANVDHEKINDLKKMEAVLRDEVAAWKDKYHNERALRERREVALTRHIGEIKQGIEHSGKDITALKTQLAEQSVQLAAFKQERDKLAAENRSLQAQVSFCDTKLRELTKVSARADRASNESVYSTPSLESLWSQRQPSSARQSRSSLSNVDQFKDKAVPGNCCSPLPATAWKGNPRRESRSGQLAQAAALDSSIFSESRFSCDEEQDVFSVTTLADMTCREEDHMGRYSELYRRNSMVPSHLKSCYPVETQQSAIPATPLKGDGRFVYAPILGQDEDTSKRKRPTQSSSSDEGASKPIWGTPSNTTPSKPKKGHKTLRTPSSVKKFLKTTFRRQ